MSLHNVPSIFVKIPSQEFIVVSLTTQTTEGLFVRTYISYPEMAFVQFARDVARETTNGQSKVVNKFQAEFPAGTGVKIQYFGYGFMDIDLRERKVRVRDFTPAKDVRIHENFFTEVLKVLKQEEGFKDFEVQWSRR